jgi:hypothetical protein
VKDGRGSEPDEMRFMKIMSGLLTTSCEGATSIVSGSLDCPPARSERFGLRLHLLCCSGCRRFDRQMEFLRSATARLKAKANDVDAPPGLLLPPEVRERISMALEEALSPPSPSLPGEMSDRRGSID